MREIKKRPNPTSLFLAFLFFIEVNKVVIHLFFFVPAFFYKFFSTFRINEIQFDLNVGIHRKPLHSQSGNWSGLQYCIFPLCLLCSF